MGRGGFSRSVGGFVYCVDSPSSLTHSAVVCDVVWFDEKWVTVIGTKFLLSKDEGADVNASQT